VLASRSGFTLVFSNRYLLLIAFLMLTYNLVNTTGEYVIARSGASTVAELAAIGRPAILVPLPHSIDQDQRANAGVLEQAGGAIRLNQDAFTPERLAAEISALAADPHRLAAMAAAAKAAGAIDAAERLADLVVETMGGDSP
jgi:UDP-N-acetylglucosamine--N-acetylmuramyl-(pentapeptide) pyrophosphoryl-undecaprenol N-acetylglucosamine transferase